MPKIKQTFKKEFQNSDVSQKETIKTKNIKKINISKFYYFILDLLSNILKIVFYILICAFVSLGATAIFNSEIRELILNIIK